MAGVLSCAVPLKHCRSSCLSVLNSDLWAAGAPPQTLLQGEALQLWGRTECIKAAHVWVVLYRESATQTRPVRP